MKEYTLAVVTACFIVTVLDRVSGVRLLSRPRYWFFLGIILVFKLIVNGCLTGWPAVVYNERFFGGVRIGTIPLEDFLFGFSMTTWCVGVWERMRTRSVR